MAGKGGGAWKVAYADFVTAMMAFFMVMWLLSQNDKVKHAVALHFRNPYGQFAVGDSLMAPRHGQYFKERARTTKGDSPPTPENAGPKTLKPYTLHLHRGDRTIVGTVVTFGPDETELSEAGRERLKGFIPRVTGKPQKIEIRGHALRRASQTDPSKDEKDPWTLSYARCLNTMKFFIDQGVPADRLRLSQAGAFEPYTLGDQPEEVANNSRIEVYMLNEVAEDALGSAEERAERYKTHGQLTSFESGAKLDSTGSHAASNVHTTPAASASHGSTDHGASSHAKPSKKATGNKSSSHKTSGHKASSHKTSGHKESKPKAKPASHGH